MTNKSSNNNKPPPAEERYDLQVLNSLRRIVRSVDLYSSSFISKYKFTAPQLHCLLAINENQQITISRLAEEVYLSASTVVGIINRLEDKNLVVRERDNQDRRIVNISVTSKGKKVIQNTPLPLQDNLAKSLSDLPQSEQATIAQSLKRIVDLMESEYMDENKFSKTKEKTSRESN